MPDLLSNAQHRTLAALAESIAPPGSLLPVDANQMGVADQLDGFLRDFDPGSRRMLRPSAGLVPLALPDLTEIDLSAPAKNAA